MIELIKYLLKSRRCKKLGHIFDEEVSCPYTGMSYSYCNTCGDRKARKSDG